MEKYEENLAPGTAVDLYKGTAFIVFDKQIDTYKILAMFDDSPIAVIFRWIKKKFCGCCVDNHVGSKYSFERAPEPNDVFWENLNIHPCHRYKNVLLTYLATLGVIGICFGIIWGINQAKIELVGNKEYSNSKWVQGLSIAVSIVIIIINMLLRVVVRRFSLFEKHETYSNHNLSVAMKLTMARFINTAIVPILVDRGFDRWTAQGGLVSDIFYLLLSIAFVDPLVYWINIPSISKKIKQRSERSKGAASLMT